MTQVFITTTIHVPAEIIWKLISDFGMADQYLDGVVDCMVEGEGVGALRTLTNSDGSTIVERLTALDMTAQQLSYTLLTDTPFGNCVTTMSLRNLGPFQAELAWSAGFQPIGIPVSEAVDLMEGALTANCLVLKQLMEAGR